MPECEECGRLNCDCEELMTDLYGTEIIPGEGYFENEHGDSIHTDNLERYVLEEMLLIKKLARSWNF